MSCDESLHSDHGKLSKTEEDLELDTSPSHRSASPKGDVISNDQRLSPSEGLTFLSDGMRDLGLYELRTRRDRVGDFLPGVALPSVVGGKWRYFSLLPRVREGSRKRDVVSQGNLLWLDVDSRDALGNIGCFEDHLGLAPSAVVDSGGGFWFYWKLNELVPSLTLERWNERLNNFARGRLPAVDEGCWNCNRTARLVGTVHEETGIEAHFVSEASTWERHDPSSVERVLPELPAVSPAPEVSRFRRRPLGNDRDEVQQVYRRFRWYLDDPPTEEEIHAKGQARHAIEFALALALIEDAECSDEEVRALFDQWLPLKHLERVTKARVKPDDYVIRTIKRARAKANPARAKKRRRTKRTYRQVDRFQVLALLEDAEDAGAPLLVKDACARIMESGCTQTTAENVLSQLEKSRPRLITKRKNPDGRGKQVLVTEKARELLAQEGFQRGFQFLAPIHAKDDGTSTGRFLRRSHQTSSVEVPEETDQTEPSTPSQSLYENEEAGEVEIGEVDLSSYVSNGKHLGFATSRFIRHAGWDCPDEQLQTLLKRNWIDDWFRISFEGAKRTRLIQFVTSWDEAVAKVSFYHQLYIWGAPYPTDDPRVIGAMSVFRSFVSQRDPRVEDGLASDPIADREWRSFTGEWIRLRPQPWSFGLAIELTETGAPKTHTVVDRSRRELTCPCFGLIVERDWAGRRGATFWASLRGFCSKNGVDLTSVVLRVTRSGAKGRHKFSFEVAGDAIAFEPPPETLIDLDVVLTELASEERLQKYVAPLSYDHIPLR